MTTTIQKWGNSQGIRIPKFLLDAVQWSDDEQLVLSADKNKIIIEKAEPRKIMHIKTKKQDINQFGTGIPLLEPRTPICHCISDEKPFEIAIKPKRHASTINIMVHIKFLTFSFDLILLKNSINHPPT